MRIKPCLICAITIAWQPAFALCSVGAQDLEGYTKSPVYLNSAKLPKRFLGNSPLELFKNLASHYTEKGQFETKAAYNKRLYAARAKPICGKMTINSLFATQLDQTTDNSLTHLPITSYNADKQEFKIQIWFEGKYEKQLPVMRFNRVGGLYHAGNAMGAETDVLRQDKYQFSLLASNYNEFGFNLADDDMFSKAVVTAYVPVWKARNIMSKVRVLALYKFISPYISQNIDYKTATYDSPTEGKYLDQFLTVRLQELWLYNFDTGEIIYKLRRKSPDKHR